MTTFAKQTHLSFAQNLRAFLTWMTHCLTLMGTIRAFFAASLSATVLHETLSRDYALSRRMAILLTCVPAFKNCVAFLATAESARLAHNITFELLSTIAQGLDWNQTRRTIAYMTIQRALMATGSDFRTGLIANR